MTNLQNIEAAEVGRRLGHDLFCFRWQPDDGLPGSVREGFIEARARRASQTGHDRFERKWLQLRSNALRRGRSFDERIVPELFRRIDVERCPVTRVALTHGEGADTDWSVDRINNDGAYAANNLALMSRKANQAKGARSFEQVHALALRTGPTDGLTPVEWMRLAAVMLGPCFAPRPHEVPALPLTAPLPRGTVRLALQQIQWVFTLNSRTQAGKNQAIKHFKSVTHDPAAELRLRRFAEAMHVALKAVDCEHDAWLRPGVMPTLLAWWNPLDDTARARAGHTSCLLLQGRRVGAGCMDAWRLPSRGYA